jgi:hypothetical protein
MMQLATQTSTNTGKEHVENLVGLGNISEKERQMTGRQ